MANYNLDDFDLSQPTQSPVPQPQKGPGPIQLPEPHWQQPHQLPPYGSPYPVQPRANFTWFWVGLFAFLTVCFLTLWLLSLKEDKDVGPRPTPVDGSYVAIFYNDTNKDKYTEDQLAFIDSAGTADFLSQKATNWKKLDVDDVDDLKGLPPVFTEMAMLPRTSEPWMVIVNGSDVYSEPIEDKDAATQLMQKALE